MIKEGLLLTKMVTMMEAKNNLSVSQIVSGFDDYTNVDWGQFLIDGVILTAVSVFGIVGTLMSIRVLVTPQLKSNAFSGLLVYLAFCDANFLVILNKRIDSSIVFQEFEPKIQINSIGPPTTTIIEGIFNNTVNTVNFESTLSICIEI